MLKYFLFSKIISVRILFLQTFYKNKQRFFNIIYSSCPQMSRLTYFCYHKALNTSFKYFKLMFLEGTDSRITLMVTLTIKALEAILIDDI